MIRVVIADDHQLVRKGIRALIEDFRDMEVVGEAGDGFEAVNLARELAPDVIVMDLAMPRLSGIHAIARIQELNVATRVVTLSMYSDLVLVREALRNGARGYLLKSSLQEELHLALTAAAAGQTYLSPAISQALLDHFLQAEPKVNGPNPVDQLTLREREVLKLVVEGYSNPAIAHALNISVRTVEKHRANLMDKLDVHDLAGLMRWAARNELFILSE